VHTLHTTEAFILGSLPEGESNKVYKLFTKNLGYVFAHGQGVREMRNRNRFALRTGVRSEVTLVRGRSTWRITGAQHVATNTERESSEDGPKRKVYVKKLHHLTASLLPQETPLTDVYDLLIEAEHAFSTYEVETLRDIEALCALRLLHYLGYVGHEQSAWPSAALTTTTFSDEVVRWAQEHRRTLLRAINGGIQSATA